MTSDHTSTSDILGWALDETVVDAHPSRAGARILVLRRRARPERPRRAAARAAAVPLGADARVPHAGAGRRRDEPSRRGARSRRHPRADPAPGRHFPVLPADRLGGAGEPSRPRGRGSARSHQGVLRRVDHAGSGTAGAALALPGVGFHNCFGQSEIGPLATVLRPEEHDARPDSGSDKQFLSSRRAWWTPS
ncbi:Long-chain-fatty-acid--CoA ligase [Amycolatopsis azurea DSM 43854]|uniref:Long-chain-fatty-acid--CoA ligase n=1 Tax=Amycolatopsis azurea DSM 43854 TaxID=1238180 RepID=M2Q4Z7_9PSEU|nr:Long-chain-fatty-acid--CoA ligase [Amycolatopsis azurea DSM 43854]